MSHVLLYKMSTALNNNITLLRLADAFSGGELDSFGAESSSHGVGGTDRKTSVLALLSAS